MVLGIGGVVTTLLLLVEGSVSSLLLPSPNEDTHASRRARTRAWATHELPWQQCIASCLPATNRQQTYLSSTRETILDAHWLHPSRPNLTCLTAGFRGASSMRDQTGPKLAMRI
jgi:hypothetical protein